MSPTDGIPRSARRVQAALLEAGVEAEIRVLDVSTRTAREAAEAVGADLGAIVKSLIFAGADSGRPLLALVSGANQADPARLEAEFGECVGRADPDLVRAATGYAIGGVPPVGHATTLTPLIDDDLLAFDQVWCAAGTPTALFAVAPAELVRITGGRVVALAARG